MTQERYNMASGSWESDSDVDRRAILEDVRTEVGNEDIAIRWDGEVPIVDSDLLPDPVGVSAVKSAIETHHPNI
jgi:hypothetical protein